MNTFLLKIFLGLLALCLLAGLGCNRYHQHKKKKDRYRPKFSSTLYSESKTKSYFGSGNIAEPEIREDTSKYSVSAQRSKAFTDAKYQARIKLLTAPPLLPKEEKAVAIKRPNVKRKNRYRNRKRVPLVVPGTPEMWTNKAPAGAQSF